MYIVILYKINRCLEFNDLISMSKCNKYLYYTAKNQNSVSNFTLTPVLKTNAKQFINSFDLRDLKIERIQCIQETGSNLLVHFF